LPTTRLRWPLGYDSSELLFRALFSTIFLGLGAEHLVDDHLILQLMPEWVPWPHLCSLASGVVLLVGGTMVLLGWHLRRAAWILGSFLVVVTVLVHLPGVIFPPPARLGDDAWMWTVLQRSNLVKNVCLLGVCVQLGWHRPGRFSVDGRRARRGGQPG